MTFFNIVVPFYNVEKWISRCVKTIRAQDYSHFKVVLVDDCSTDNTNNVAKEEIKNDDNFHLIRKNENGGALSSICKGIEFLNPSPSDRDWETTLK